MNPLHQFLNHFEYSADEISAIWIKKGINAAFDRAEEIAKTAPLVKPFYEGIDEHGTRLIVRRLIAVWWDGHETATEGANE